MFGRGSHLPPPVPLIPHRSASVAAQIVGGGLVQLIVTNEAPLTFYLFLNDTTIAQEDFDSLSIDIEMPTDADSSPLVRATLARYVVDVTGSRTLQRTELFPCTIEIVARGRRISLTATRADSLDGLWIDLGMRADGTGNVVNGATAMRFLLNEQILDARLTTADGGPEDLLPT